jgi:uncharacterized membrane protein YoaK (UPF0700 family)
LSSPVHWHAALSPPAATNRRLLAFTWIGYLVGAVIGALLLTVMPYPLLVPAALLLVVISFTRA